jgi:hypothetical protein
MKPGREVYSRVDKLSVVAHILVIPILRRQEDCKFKVNLAT